MEDNIYTRLAVATWAALAVGASGCGGGDDGPTPPEPGAVLLRASKSSTIAQADDLAHVAMVNPDDGTLSVFQTTDLARTAKVATGNRPSSVVIAADNSTAYVANRDDGTVVRVIGLDTAAPSVDATVQVGAEPVGVALSPTGAKLFVAELAESRVSVIDTRTMQVTSSMPVDRPRALVVTNNADDKDEDEQLIVPQFFGVPVPGGEGKDDGRIGHVQVFALADLAAPPKTIELAPTDSGFGVKTSPNQLSAIAVANGRLVITSTSASPQGPTKFDNNVFPVVYIADLATGLEVTGPGGTTNLARKIYDAIPAPSAASPRFIPGELADLAFKGDSSIAYTVGRAGDVMVRMEITEASVDIGSTQNKEIDLAGNDTLGKCQGPTGIVVDDEHNMAYVNCWITRRIARVDLGAQQLVQTAEASPAPADAVEASVQRGKRFYFTGRGRWSAAVANGAKGGEGWSSCGSCHPDGLTDNMTWSFGAGPRQTTSQDGTFSHGPGPQKMRILNWTGIFDEHHDFERNTRDVSGGLGAITTAPTAADCNQLDKETQVSLAGIGGLQRPLKELADDPQAALCGHKDWDDIDAYVRTIEPVHAAKTVDAAAVARGRQLFTDGGCAKCHGGAGWTVSRRFFTPSGTTNASLASTAFPRPSFFPATWMYDNGGQARALLSGQPAIASADATGPAEPAPIGIGQLACVTRNVGTFGALDPANTDALEVRLVNGSLVRAQGRAGYNVPSLYGLALGAPYLHDGQAPSLAELFSNGRWAFHTNAANANFSATLQQAGKLDDLVAFLRTIDAASDEVAVPTDPGSDASFDACP